MYIFSHTHIKKCIHIYIMHIFNNPSQPNIQTHVSMCTLLSHVTGRDSLTLESQALDMAQNAVYLADKLNKPMLQGAALLNVATLMGPSPKTLQVGVGMADAVFEFDALHSLSTRIHTQTDLSPPIHANTQSCISTQQHTCTRTCTHTCAHTCT